MKIKWCDSSVELPEENQDILLISSDGVEVIGKFCMNRFCVGDIYLYYLPKYWIDLTTAILSGRT